MHWSCRLRNKSGSHSTAKQRTIHFYIQEWQPLNREAEDNSFYIQEWQPLNREAEDNSFLYTRVAATQPRSRAQLRLTYTRCPSSDTCHPNVSLSAPDQQIAVNDGSFSCCRCWDRRHAVAVLAAAPSRTAQHPQRPGVQLHPGMHMSVTDAGRYMRLVCCAAWLLLCAAVL